MEVVETVEMDNLEAVILVLALAGVEFGLDELIHLCVEVSVP